MFVPPYPPLSSIWLPRPELSRHIPPLPLQEQRFPEAFSALSEAVKYKRESWQTWANYAHAALKTAQPLQAARGVQQVPFLSPDTLHYSHWESAPYKMSSLL